MPSALQIKVLGELCVLRNGEEVRLPQSKKARALLGYLAITARAHRRRYLCSLLWDVVDDPRAALRWTLTKVRSVVDDDEVKRLLSDRTTAELQLREGELDLEVVRRIADARDRCTEAELDHALGLFGGELLEGLELGDFDEYQAWCYSLREDARRLQSQIAEALLQRATDPERAVQVTNTLLQLDPLDEGRRIDLAQRLHGLGRTEEAEHAIQGGIRLATELGRPVGAALTEMQVRLRRAAPAPVTSTATPRVDRPAPGAAPRVSSPIAKTTVHGLRMVGRLDERRQIAALLDEVSKTQRGHVLLISGAPGVGKSRLVVESMMETRRRRGTVIDGCAYEGETSRPYGPFTDAFRRLTKRELSGELEQRLAPLISHAAVGEDVTPDQLYDAVRSLISKCAQERAPVLLTFDDLQWFDAASADLLHYTLRHAKKLPVLGLLTAREGELVDNSAALRAIRGLRRERMLTEMTVGPLSREETATLVRSVAPKVDADTVFESSAGNPLFALEFARSGEEGGSPTLRQVVRDRLARLPEDALDVLRWASVLGTTFSAPMLEGLVSLDVSGFVTALEVLEQHALVGGVIDVEAPGMTYQFSHEFVRRTVYADLSMPRRRLMHLRAAQRIAQEGGASSHSEVAHHASIGGDPALAASAFAAAAARANELFAFAQAVSLVERGQRCALQLPEAQRVDVEARLREQLQVAEARRGA